MAMSPMLQMYLKVAQEIASGVDIEAAAFDYSFYDDNDSSPSGGQSLSSALLLVQVRRWWHGQRQWI